MNPEYNRRTTVALQFAASMPHRDAAFDAMRDALDTLNGRAAVSQPRRNAILDNLSEMLSFVYRLNHDAAEHLASAALTAALEDARHAV